MVFTSTDPIYFVYASFGNCIMWYTLVCWSMLELIPTSGVNLEAENKRRFELPALIFWKENWCFLILTAILVGVFKQSPWASFSKVKDTVTSNSYSLFADSQTYYMEDHHTTSLWRFVCLIIRWTLLSLRPYCQRSRSMSHLLELKILVN